MLKLENRLNMKHVILASHIWHAKRFHTLNKWGYKIPWKRKDVGVRFIQRSSDKECIIQDISFSFWSA
eukprot:UN29913